MDVSMSFVSLLACVTILVVTGNTDAAVSVGFAGTLWIIIMTAIFGAKDP